MLFLYFWDYPFCGRFEFKSFGITFSLDKTLDLFMLSVSLTLEQRKDFFVVMHADKKKIM